jgi:hypothetical protein
VARHPLVATYAIYAFEEAFKCVSGEMVLFFDTIAKVAIEEIEEWPVDANPGILVHRDMCQDKSKVC